MVVWTKGNGGLDAGFCKWKEESRMIWVHWGSRNDWAPVHQMWGSHPGVYCSPKPGVRWGEVGGTYVGIFYQSKWKWV